ncbi:hypothetical protein E2C01_089043 [Portunus trituberculatus]|nr:hypothetical protein [Portunus trituberculatus]
MWVSVYAIVVLGAAGVLAESPEKDNVVNRQGSTEEQTNGTTPFSIASVVK